MVAAGRDNSGGRVPHAAALRTSFSPTYLSSLPATALPACPALPSATTTPSRHLCLPFASTACIPACYNATMPSYAHTCFTCFPAAVLVCHAYHHYIFACTSTPHHIFGSCYHCRHACYRHSPYPASAPTRVLFCFLLTCCAAHTCSLYFFAALSRLSPAYGSTRIRRLPLFLWCLPA